MHTANAAQWRMDGMGCTCEPKDEAEQKQMIAHIEKLNILGTFLSQADMERIRARVGKKTVEKPAGSRTIYKNQQRDPKNELSNVVGEHTKKKTDKDEL